MPSDSLIAEHRKVQCAAKFALSQLVSKISATDTERSIADKAYSDLRGLGYPQTWYHQCPAFVLLGSRSCLSVSGKEYVPSLEPVGDFNLVTVDLSPAHGAHWGDCARSFFVEDGSASFAPKSAEFRFGKQFLEALHAEMRMFVRPKTTFHALYEWARRRISLAGFENLDFLGNVGHSIASKNEDQQFIESGNHHQLNQVPFFTFEPHVRIAGGRWGFKHENIFFFNDDGIVEEL